MSKMAFALGKLRRALNWASITCPQLVYHYSPWAQSSRARSKNQSNGPHWLLNWI